MTKISMNILRQLLQLVLIKYVVSEIGRVDECGTDKTKSIPEIL